LFLFVFFFLPLSAVSGGVIFSINLKTVAAFISFFNCCSSNV